MRTMMVTVLWVVTMTALACCCAATMAAAVAGGDGEERRSTPLHSLQTLHFKVISLDAHNATEESYRQFLDAIRDHVGATGDVRHRIPVLPLAPPPPPPPPPAEAFLLVELRGGEELSITLALRVTNLYLEAYRVGDRAYFFDDSTAPATVFPDTLRQSLRFGSNYNDLQRVAGDRREHIDLGMATLAQVVRTLVYMGQPRPVARALLVVIQMVCEAARFRYIERHVIRNWDGFRPNPPMLSLEQNWGSLSSAIQNSDEAGNFNTMVILQNNNNTAIVAQNVRDIGLYLALMLFVCPGRPHRSPLPPFHMLLTTTAGPVDGGLGYCTASSHEMRFTGAGNLCVDVKNNDYSDGNAVQLWKCIGGSNQVWTVESDGTIRSKGKCLTTYGYRAGSYLMIYDCALAVREARLWHLSDDGTVTNPESRLVLSATPGTAGTALSVQTPDFTLSQSWSFNIIPGPRLTSIVGFKGLCLRGALETGVWVGD